MKKIIFVIGDIGGGHISTSRAIADALHRKYPGSFETEIVDIFEHSDPFLDWYLKEGYSLSSNKFIWIYGTLFYLTDFPWMIRFQSSVMGQRVISKMTKFLNKKKPDMIVSVHPFTSHPMTSARENAGLKNLPIFTVVSDPFTGHSAWFCDKRSDLYIVLSRLQAIRAEMDGIPRDNIFVTQIPINPKFNQPLSENEINQFARKHKVNRNHLTILMAGGGEGLRRSIPIIRQLNKFKDKPNILVVCARNKEMYRNVSLMARKHPNIKPFKFVNFMYELMNLSDMIVLKAGPATIAEALSLKKPIIINSYVWGQERGNVNFCTKNKIGFYIPSSFKVAKKIIEIEKNPQILTELKQNIEKLKLYNGSKEIAQKIGEYFNLEN